MKRGHAYVVVVLVEFLCFLISICFCCLFYKVGCLLLLVCSDVLPTGMFSSLDSQTLLVVLVLSSIGLVLTFSQLLCD